MQKRLAEHDERVAKIKAHIKLVAEGIRELSQLPEEVRPRGGSPPRARPFSPSPSCVFGRAQCTPARSAG